jgi:putative ABC transport system ATP-binding protein
VLFELEGVELERGGKPVLRGVDARLPMGSSCVAGPSGCGKSTLLRLLNRLADPQAGRVLYRGQDVREREPLALRREVMLVPQLPALVEGTVADNLALAARLAQTEPDPEAVLGDAGLDASYAERDARRLSVGEQQRAMLARALAAEPRVLLLDEPTASLDATARDAIEATLGDLRERRDLSVVLVTHDLAQARRMAEWVVRMDAGRVVAQGPAKELLVA